MFKAYCDLNHDTIINYTANLNKNTFGKEKISKIFFDAKNSIYYDTFAPLQFASETLVMGRGNNLDKTILLFTLLKANGFKSKIQYNLVKDNTKRLVSRNNKITPWFYVEVDFFGNNMVFDPSFDSSFMRAAGITYKGSTKEYNFKEYIVKDTKLFTVVQSGIGDVDEKWLSWLKEINDSNTIINNIRVSFA